MIIINYIYKKKRDKVSSKHFHTYSHAENFTSLAILTITFQTFIGIYLSFVCFSCEQVMLRFYLSLYKFMKYNFNIFLALLCDSEVTSVFNLLCRKFHEEAALFLMEKEPQDRVFECSMMTECFDECCHMIMKIIRFCKII